MKNLITVFLILILSIPAFAGAPGDDVMFVSGTVVDKQTNESLAGVEVRIKGTSIVTYTDFNGNFFFSDLPTGTYELSFRYITYESTKTITGDCHNCPTVSVQLAQR